MAPHQLWDNHQLKTRVLGSGLMYSNVQSTEHYLVLSCISAATSRARRRLCSTNFMKLRETACTGTDTGEHGFAAWRNLYEHGSGTIRIQPCRASRRPRIPPPRTSKRFPPRAGRRWSGSCRPGRDAARLCRRSRLTHGGHLGRSRQAVEPTSPYYWRGGASRPRADFPRFGKAHDETPMVSPT
ncbi:hypothetical protein IMZ48_40150 [Candidatus Bathyarchaeota archaeon]|nr:hypothetical protein [Candidatus Bathyarchaeota archaeon]